MGAFLQLACRMRLVVGCWGSVKIMTTDETAVRWGDGRRADSDFAREQILDAAWRCYQKNTVHKTRMEHIAREAKVSRTTIYRYFQSRDEVQTGVILRAVHELMDRLRERVEKSETFAEFLVEALVSTAEHVRHSSMFSMLQKEETELMSRVYGDSKDVFTIISEHFRPYFDAAKAAGELRNGLEFEPFMAWTLHVLSGYVIAVSPLRGLTEWREMLWRFLVPSIVREEAIPADKRF